MANGVISCRARGRNGERRAVQIKLHRDVRRDHAAGVAAEPFAGLSVTPLACIVVDLDELRLARCGPDRHPGASPAQLCQLDPGIIQRLTRRRDRQLRGPPHAFGRQLLQVVLRLEIAHFGPNLHRESRGVERDHRTDAVLPRKQRLPEAVAPRPHGRDYADARDDDPSHGARWRMTVLTASFTVRICANSSSGMLILNFLSTVTMTSIAISESTPRSSANRAVSDTSSGSRSVTVAISFFISARTSSAVICPFVISS